MFCCMAKFYCQYIILSYYPIEPRGKIWALADFNFEVDGIFAIEISNSNISFMFDLCHQIIHWIQSLDYCKKSKIKCSQHRCCTWALSLQWDILILTPIQITFDVMFTLLQEIIPTLLCVPMHQIPMHHDFSIIWFHMLLSQRNFILSSIW